MTAQIIIAPPGHGKTHACLLILQDILAADPCAPVMVVTGSRLQAGAFRQQLAVAGGAIGVRVGTFRDLYREIIERSAALQPVASPTLQFRVTQKALEIADLDYFSTLRRLPGFVKTIQSLVGELERSLVSPETLAQTLAAGRKGLSELATIYRSYQDTLSTIGWTDLESQPAKALAALMADPDLMLDLALLVVDGVDWFDPAQRGILQALSGRVQRILITLPGDPGWSRTVHRGYMQSYQELSTFLPLQTLEISPTTHLPAPVAALEANLRQTSPTRLHGHQPGIDMIEARSPGEEAREALRWIKRQVCETGCSPGDFAVLVRDPEPYFATLRSTAAEFGLAVRFTQSRILAEIPMIRAVLELLALPAGGYAYRPLFASLRSPFFNFAALGLTTLQIDTLDLVSRYGKVVEGLEQWQDVFQTLQSMPLEDGAAQVDDENYGALPVLPRGPAAAPLYKVFQRFIRLVSPPQGESPLIRWITWLEDLLSALSFYPITSQELDPESRSVVMAFRDCLQELLAAETAAVFLGERALDYAGFVALLQSVLENAEWMAPDNPHRPAITVMRMLEARGLRYPFVAVLGLSEGIFPRVERPDPILDEDLRAQLGMQSRLGQDQLGLFYQAVTRADRGLLLTRPYLTDTGDPWEPSPYWNAVRAIFPDLVRRVRPEDLRPLADAASPDELLFWHARLKGIGTSDLQGGALASLSQRYASVRSAQIRLKALLKRVDGANSPAAPAELIALAGARFGTDHVWSVTRLESYLSCPFRFFVENMLQVEAHNPPEWDFDVSQLGSMLHSILERAYRTAGDPADVQQVLDALQTAAEEVFHDAPRVYAFRPSPLWDRQRAELYKKLEDTVNDLAALGDGWRPLYFELPFGMQGQPPLELVIDGRIIRLRGVIDRVDRNENGDLRIVDYKTGGSHLSKSDLIEGRRLQLPIYAQAAQDALDLGEPVDGFYWRIGPGGRSSLRLGNFVHEQYRGPQGAMALAYVHIADAVTRLGQADFSSTPLGGKCTPYCAAGAWCWHNKPEQF